MMYRPFNPKTLAAFVRLMFLVREWHFDNLRLLRPEAELEVVTKRLSVHQFRHQK